MTLNQVNDSAMVRALIEERDRLNVGVTELVALLRRARAVIPSEYEDEIEVRAAINSYLNDNGL